MISLSRINVTFNIGSRTVEAARDIDLHVNEGDVFGIVGYSGAGKSTLVRVMNLLQRPTSGEVTVNGQNLLALRPRELRAARKKIGMIFQHFNLMKSRTVYDNVLYPLKSSRMPKKDKDRKVRELLELVGLSDKLGAYPSQLSGGQKQRVAIARALANDPRILLCDEATSALDPKTTLSILDLLRDLNRKLGLTIVIITHEMQVVKEICNKVAVMEEGRIVEQGDIVSIFSDPKQPLTRDFIHTATHFGQTVEKIMSHPSLTRMGEHDRLCKISFVGERTGEAVVSDIASRFGVSANILFGNVEILRQTPVGSLIVVLSGGRTELDKALAYLRSLGVEVEQMPSPSAFAQEGGERIG